MHEITEPHVAPDAGPREARKPWTLLALLCAAQFMVILDVTVVNVALPTIGRELHFAANDLQWVVTTYVLFTGGLLLLGGRLADLLDRRAVFLTGLTIFTTASLTSGLAPTSAALIFSRGAQGVGAALLSPAALSIITTTYTGAQRTTALSTWGAIAGGGAAAGVLLGGMLTTWLSWEWIFFINVPIGAFTAVIALRLLPAARTNAGSLSELDLPGAVTLVSGLLLLVYAVVGTSTYGWGSARTLGLVALSGTLLAAFAVVERRARRPLIPTTTWQVRSLVSSATVMLGATGILVGTFFLNSLFLQNVLRTSALETGLAFLPLVLVTGIAAHVGPQLLARVGARNVVVGGLALAAGGELFLSGAPANANYLFDLLPGFLLVGFGVGLTFVTVSVTAMSEIQGERAGLASGLMTTAHEIGGAFGVSIFSAVALGAGAAAGAGLAGGYSDAARGGALIAAGLAILALVTVPRFRPLTAEQAALH